ncbi:MAG: hypothetical protein ACHQ53_10610 [Polyangiales bacterium]
MTSSCIARFALALCGTLALAAGASAQNRIDQPRGHDHYTAELEPHLVVQWADQWSAAGDGIGVGLRASIPVIEDGPVETINNSFALTFGLDWAHFGNQCYYYYGYNGPVRAGLPRGDCNGNDFWLPIAVQWNFYFSKLISAFPEVGLGIHHWTWDTNVACPNGYACSGSDTGVDLVLWLGVRFHLAKSFALTLRLGTPSLLLGASFFL